MRREISTIVAIVLASLAGAQARAQENADSEGFFKGRTMRVIVGYGPGGGYDVYARLLAEHLPRFLPGGPVINVQYMPGAATEVATAYILNAAPQDGSVIGIPVSGLPMSNLIFKKPGEAGIDISKMRWIGRLDVIDTVAIVWNTTGVKKVEDLKTQPLVFGATATTSSTFMMPVILNKLSKGKFKIVLGYRGTSDAYLAMERREIDGMHNGVWSQIKRSRQNWLRDNLITVLYQHSERRAPDLPDVPTIIELADNEQDRRMFALFASEATLGRTFYVSNGVPRPRIAILRDAFQKMVADKTFLEAAEKLDTPINSLGGEEIEKIVSDMASYPPELFERVRQLTAQQ